MTTLLEVLGVDREVARFWARVDQSGECWLWLGSTNDKGYGQFSIRNKRVYVH